MSYNIFNIFYSEKKTAYYALLLAQIFILFISLILLIKFNLIHSLSFFLGSLAWFLPNFYFSRKIFQKINIISRYTLLTRFYLAEITKFLLSAIILLIIIKYFKINILILLTGYIIAIIILIISQWMVFLFPMFRERESKRS